MGKENNDIDINKLITLLKQRHLLIRAEVPKDLTAQSFSYNSRLVTPGCLFICKGYNFKTEYLTDAIDKGAVCYITEQLYDTDKPFIHVRDVRKALALVAGLYYDTLVCPLTLIGVTGTKGKSTTVYFLYNILSSAGLKCAYSTTVDMYDGKNTTEAILTTPESDVCQRNIRAASDNGCDYFIMEASSQSIKLDRIYNLTFKYGIFVNISNDHISPHEHTNFDDYFDCKQQIVRKYENSVINFDDEHFEEVYKTAAENSEQILSYSIKSDKADVYACNLRKEGFMTDFTIRFPDKTELEAKVNMPGVFNVSNALAASAIAYLMGIEPGAIVKGLSATSVVGRMAIFERNGYTAIVDYAHNESSMAAALTAIREYYPNKKLSVAFGCPGGKGLQRRKDMAYEASLSADYVYVTSEDPGSEDPLCIASEVKAYLDEYRTPNEIILDRKQAVETAIKNMKKDEIVLITGKGAEHYQLYAGAVTPYEGDTVLTEKYIKMYK